MSDMIRGPIDPGHNPDRLKFDTFEDEKQGQQEEEKEEYQSQRRAARFASLGIDPHGFSEDELDRIVKELEHILSSSSQVEEFLGKLLSHYGFDMAKRNLPPASHTTLINTILRRVLLFELKGSRARDAIETILKKHQVADRNPFGL